MAIESTLGRTPGAAGTMADKAASIQDQLQATLNATRDSLSPVYGPVPAGDALRGGITDYKARGNQIFGRMLDRGMNAVPPDATFPVNAMLSRGPATLPTVPGAPNVSSVLTEPLGYTQRLIGALNKDASAQPPQVVPSPIVGPNGLPFTTTLPGTPGGLPMQALRDIRTQTGMRAYPQNPLMADANQGAMKALYGASKQDLYSAAASTDVQRMLNGQHPVVLNQFQRADNFNTAIHNVLSKTLEPIYRARRTRRRAAIDALRVTFATRALRLRRQWRQCPWTCAVLSRQR
jgi:hypothetical protein